MDLPDELIEIIFNNLNISHQRKMLITCKKLYKFKYLL